MPPRIKDFIPLGYYGNETESISLYTEEYEAIRLMDYENLSQADAALYMEVSRPTLTRIYAQARQKIAMAITEARPLMIEGGKAVFEGEWYTCDDCNCRFNNPTLQPVDECPLCTGNQVRRLIHNAS